MKMLEDVRTCIIRKQITCADFKSIGCLIDIHRIYIIGKCGIRHNISVIGDEG